VVVTAVLIGLVFYGGYRDVILEQQRRYLSQRLTGDAGRLRLSLSELKRDARLLAEFPALKRLLKTASGAVDSDSHLEAKYAAQQEFKSLLRSKPQYEQARLIAMSDGGRELIRVERQADRVLAVEDAQLQEKGMRDYFRHAIGMAPEDIYLSSIDLNKEHNEVQVPHNPTLRAAVPVEGEGGLFGIVVINLRFYDFLREIISLDSSEVEYYLTNHYGDYLFHPNRQMTFGFDLGQRHLLQDDHPAMKSLFSSESDAERIEQDLLFRSNGSLYCFHRVDIYPEGDERFLVLGGSASQEFLANSTAQIHQRALVVTIVLVLLSLAVGYIAVTVIIRPIQQITLEARRITMGTMKGRLPVDRNDEVGVLAGALEHMIKNLNAHEAEILRVNASLKSANLDLEHFTHVAAHDLREPLRKQRNLIELLKEEIPGESERESRSLLTCIDTCSVQMATMVQDFQDLTTLGQDQVTRQQIDMKQMISLCVSEKKPELIERNITVQFDSFPELTSAYRPMMEMLYRNLIRNALMNASVQDGELSFTAVQQSGEWVFGVRNRGSKIPHSHFVTVFEMFGTADSSNSEQTGGGLSLCRTIIEKHRGRIWAESDDDFVHILFTLGEPE
jgi:signal transduction histidine kinase